MADSSGIRNQTKEGLTILVVIILALTVSQAGAGPIYDLNVTYTGGSIISGPLSFGLSELPDSVNATFALGPGVEGTEPEDIGKIFFGLDDVFSARTTFGDGTWTSLNNFSMTYISATNNVTNLTYTYNAIDTKTVKGGMDLNFPLTITGVDISSGDEFRYEYLTSTQELTPQQNPVPEPAAIFLFGFGILGIAGVSRKRSAQLKPCTKGRSKK